MLPAGSEPTFPSGIQPAPTLCRGDITGNTGSAAAPNSVLLLAAANGCVDGASEAPAHMCHDCSSQWSPLALTAQLGFPAPITSRVHIVTARLHACSLVGTATLSLTSCLITLQIWAAEHKVARLVAVVAGA